MKAALVQIPIVWEDKDANFQMVTEMLADTSFSDGGLIVLPELFATGFTMNSESIAEDDFGPSEAFLVELAKEKSAHVIGGVAKNRKSGGKPWNCAVMVSPTGEIISRYRKTHPFSLGEEHEHYSAGDTAETVEIESVQVCPTVCYDLRFPELFRIGAKNGAEVFVVIANWPDKRNQHWITLLQARAIENQACVIGVNRCGEDPNLSYLGSTIAVDYMGEIIADAGSSAGVIEAEFDIDSLRDWRRGFPALRDINRSLS